MKVNNLKKQRGIATVLIVLLVGVALSASTLGVIYSVKSTQNKQVTSHASTNAQAAAWALAEAGRAYLAGLSPAEFTSLNTAIDTAIAEGKQGYKLTLAYPDSMAHLRQSRILLSYIPDISGKPGYELNINAIDTLSKASAVLNVFYEIIPGSPGQQCFPKGSNHFTGDLIGDAIDLYIKGPQNEISVDGSYGSVNQLHSIHGIKSFKVTGDLGLDGTAAGDTLVELQANGTIDLKIASARTDSSTRVHAGGDVIINTNDAHFGEIIAGGGIRWVNHNGSTDNMQAGVKITGPISYKDDNKNFVEVELDADGYRLSPVVNGESLGSIDFQKSSFLHRKLLSRATLTIANDMTVSNAYSLDNLLLSGYGKAIGDAMAVNDLECTATPTISNPVAGLSIRGCTGIDITDIGNTEAVKADIESEMTSYNPLDLPPSLIADADNYNANYSFRATGSAPNFAIEVTVSNIKGLAENTEKTFTLNGNILMDNGESTGFNICGNAEEPCITITNDNLLTNEELSNVETSNSLRTEADDRGVREAAVPDGLWTITSKALALAPGVYYFDRDLRIDGYNHRNYVNTILSAGSIKPTNPIRLFAVNGVPDAVLCNNHNFSVASAQHSAGVDITTDSATEFFPPQNGVYPYPTNFCAVVDGSTVRVPSNEDYVGQFGLMAGQENDDTEGNPVTYQGGNIYFISSFEVYGRVIAGNTIKSIAGNAQIFGIVGSEARAEGKNKAVNELNGTLDVNTGYMEVLDKGGEDENGNCTPSNETSSSSKLIWSRYL